VKVADLVNVTEQRGIGVFRKDTPLGIGLVLHVAKTDDISIFAQEFNLGDDVTVALSSGKVMKFCASSLKVIK
jgi:hypothetical protein